MRICFVSKEVAGMRGGGIGTYVAEAGKALSAHGHEVWLLTEHPGDDRLHLLDRLPGFHKVLPVGEGVPSAARQDFAHGWPHYTHSHLVHQTLQQLGVTFDYIEFPDYEAEGLTVFQEQRLFGSYDGTVLGLMLHSPTWECFYYDKQEHRADLNIRETCNLEEEAIRIAPMIQSPSAGLRDHVLQRLGLERDVALIRYPMQLPAASPPPPAPDRRLEDLRFLYYGRIEPRKGIDELVEAFRRLPQLQLELIGGDVPYSPYGTSFRAWVEKRAPANVRFRDPLPRPQLLERLAEVDVCIFPSLFENWPNTCIEAMAAARVVVGSKWGGMAEMIEDGVSGFLVDGRDPADIVRGIDDGVGRALGRLDQIGRAAARRMRAFCDQRTYCQALQQRIEWFRRGRKPAAAIDPAAHKVSVVIPFYKDRDTIDEAVDSAIAQRHENLEILIVDDGSPLADAQQLLERQRAKDPRVQLLRKPNGGLSSARNHGIERASGEFLLFLDADNRLRPDYAADAVAALLRCPESVFAAPQVWFFDDASKKPIIGVNPLPFDRTTGLLLNRFGDAGACFRASVFRQHGLRYDELLISYEDWALWMDLERLGLRGERVPRLLYDYRVRRDSMMVADAAPNHPALIGLLLHRHFPDTTPAERALVTTLFQVAGRSVLGVMNGQPDRLPAPAAAGAGNGEAHGNGVATTAQPPPEREFVLPRRAAPPPLRYKLVDEVSRISRKVPGLNRTMRGLLGAVFALGRRTRRR